MVTGYSDQYGCNGIIIDSADDFDGMTEEEILEEFRESGAVAIGLEEEGEESFVVQFPSRPGFEIYTERALLSSIKSMLQDAIRT